MSATGHLRDEIARLSEMIGTARQKVAMGAAVDLGPVGDGVRALCGMVAALPPELGRTVREDLVQLSARLGRLGADIEARRADNGAVSAGGG